MNLSPLLIVFLGLFIFLSESAIAARRAAGVLFYTRSPHGNTFVLLGKNLQKDQAWSSLGGYCKREEADLGDCAVQQVEFRTLGVWGDVSKEPMKSRIKESPFIEDKDYRLYLVDVSEKVSRTPSKLKGIVESFDAAYKVRKELEPYFPITAFGWLRYEEYLLLMEGMGQEKFLKMKGMRVYSPFIQLSRAKKEELKHLLS